MEGVCRLLVVVVAKFFELVHVVSTITLSFEERFLNLSPRFQIAILTHGQARLLSTIQPVALYAFFHSYAYL